MSDKEEFQLKPDADPASGHMCGGCPLSRIPIHVWQKILYPPFHRRHPVFCIIALLLVLGCLASALAAMAGGIFGKSRVLALVSVRGVINDVAPLLEWTRKIADDDAIKGVLVRVDSPGGGAAASQEVYLALKNLAASRPVAVSMGSTAASGGLMVSMAGQRVFANPSTVTGSIGVRMDIPQLQGLMQKIGISQETLVTGPYKDAASWTKPLTREDRAYLNHVLEDMHSQFVDIVAEGRHMPREKARALANGKIFTGQEALALGLVDELGGQQEAIAWLCAQTGIPASRPLKKRKTDDGLLKGLQRLAGTAGLGDMALELTRPAFLYQMF